MDPIRRTKRGGKKFPREIIIITIYTFFTLIMVLAFVLFGGDSDFVLRFGYLWLAGFLIVTISVSVGLWMSLFRRRKDVELDAVKYERTAAIHHRSRKIYGDLIEHMDEVIWKTDANGNFTFVNSSIKKLTGYSAREFKRYSLREIIPRRPYVKAMDELTRNMGDPGASGSHSVTIPIERPKKDGGRLWIEVSMTSRWNTDGKLSGFQGLFRDITENKEEKTVRDRKNHLRNMHREVKYIKVTSTDEKKLLDDICGAALEVGDYSYCWIGFALRDREKTVRPVAHRGFPERYFDYAKITWADNIWGGGPAGRAIRTGKPAIARKLDRKKAPQARVSGDVLHSYGSSIALPLKDENRVFGALSLYAKESYSFGREEVRLLLRIAAETSEAISMLSHSRSEQKRSERALRESEDRFVAFMNHLPAAVFIKDEMSRMLYANPYMKKHMGAVDWIGKSPHEHLPKEKADAVISDDHEVLAVGYKSHLELRRDIGGEERVFQAEKFVITREGNPPLLGGIELDITDWKRVEDELKRRLTQTQTLYQLSRELMYSGTLDDVCHKTLTSICAGFSLAGGFLLTLEPEMEVLELKEVIGFRDADTELELPLEDMTGVLRRAVGEREYIHINGGYEYSTGDPAALPDDFVDAQGFPGPDDSFIIAPIHSKETVYGVVILDLSDHDDFPDKAIDMLAMYLSTAATAFENVGLYQKLGDSYKKLKEVDKKRSDFIDVAAHELRTPLSSIKIYTDLMSRGQVGNFSEKEISYIEDMKSNISHLNKLINEMLDYTRTNATILNFPIGEFDLTDVAREIVEDFKTVAATRSISLEMHSEGDTIARFNLELMKKAVKNLVSNAIKYSHDGGDIRIDVTGDRYRVTVAITDNGIGIPEEHISRIFERFYMGDMSLTRERDKMGLGLPITKSIVEGHGGKISAESKVGEGSTFRFTIPKRSRSGANGQ